MPIPPEWSGVISQLERGTRSKKLLWRDSGNGRTFRVSFPNRTFSIWRWSDPDEPFPREGTSMQLFDDKGQAVDVVVTPDGDSEGARMRTLYETARRQALGIDTLLKEIEEEIRSVVDSSGEAAR